jgi:hypothetical protein
VVCFLHMKAKAVTFANQPTIAQMGDLLAPWHREGTQARTSEWRSG